MLWMLSIFYNHFWKENIHTYVCQRYTKAYQMMPLHIMCPTGHV